MNSSPATYQVVIVGGGPVGLFLGICLEKAGISSLILEKRSAPRSGSRSLGIHPVSLELFQELNIADSFVNAGIKICRGHAFANTKKLGTLSFEDCPPPFNFVLALPQSQTETILEKKLRELNPEILKRDAEVARISQKEKCVEVCYNHAGKEQSVTADYLIGCDGKNSIVRRQAGLLFNGKAYPDTYIMGDFSDNTDFGSDAAIFLCDEGLIESFPLANNGRRWVVKTSSYFSDVVRKDIDSRVEQRIDHKLEDTENYMLSSFGVQKLVARPMVSGRIIVAGDAAHVVSPIGGQGMNLGWLGAWDLAQSLNKILSNNQKTKPVLAQFEIRRTKAAKNAIGRAEMNMRLGRETPTPFFRNAIVSLMMKEPMSSLMARIFTMRGIERWVI